ncbi:hypothetical protein [Klenkia brasiliensis]|uniref:Uncharacterized protein n=1 Tax=Klenkia brasiliensis TaxID=333142 RepID=A0A1G7YET3_9ACTN|nr:hypothetical protein [Klenkia brasiliensis]SDG94826.1 hypothetical protein SAMN05660324_3928 [Klenkia brasiliensis]
MRYVRDVPADDESALQAEREHVVAHLSAVAAADDDPETNADDVRVWVQRHPEDPALLRVVGELDADPDAPYLRDDFDPWAGVDHDLFAEQIAAAEADLEVLRGQA